MNPHAQPQVATVAAVWRKSACDARHRHPTAQDRARNPAGPWELACLARPTDPPSTVTPFQMVNFAILVHCYCCILISVQIWTLRHGIDSILWQCPFRRPVGPSTRAPATVPAAGQISCPGLTPLGRYWLGGVLFGGVPPGLNRPPFPPDPVSALVPADQDGEQHGLRNINPHLP